MDGGIWVKSAPVDLYGERRRPSTLSVNRMIVSLSIDDLQPENRSYEMPDDSILSISSVLTRLRGLQNREHASLSSHLLKHFPYTYFQVLLLCHCSWTSWDSKFWFKNNYCLKNSSLSNSVSSLSKRVIQVSELELVFPILYLFSSSLSRGSSLIIWAVQNLAQLISLPLRTSFCFCLSLHLTLLRLRASFISRFHR